jgi:predicted Ser/Thr protein kinase
MLLQYRILEKLGQGGMGVVYLAEDTRLGRKVALKMIRPGETGDAHRRQRLEQEARAAAMLVHPSIATVFALEDSPAGVFIVFEYVQGETLRSLVRSGGLDPDPLCDIAAGIVSALDAAHSAGIVHRDLKPENVMRTHSGGCKVLDFGLARIDSILEGDGTRSRLTSAGTVLGTISYMSPEQLEACEVDFRSDIFSFGTMLYELATGVHPFESGSHASTIAAVLKSEPPPVIAHSRVHPQELDRIIRKCLRKKREDRYQSTRDLLVDLRNLKSESRERQPLSVPAASVDDETSLFRSIRARVPSARRWWEINLLFAMAFLLAVPFGAWWVRNHATEFWQTGAMNVVFMATVVTVGFGFALRLIEAQTAVFAPADLPQRVRAFGPWLRIVTCANAILYGVMAPELTVARYPLLTPLLLLLAALTLAWAFVFEPLFERTAFPAPAAASSAEEQALRRGRGWWWTHHLMTMFATTPVVVTLFWQAHRASRDPLFVISIFVIFLHWSVRFSLVNAAIGNPTGLLATVRRARSWIQWTGWPIVILLAVDAGVLFFAGHYEILSALLAGLAMGGVACLAFLDPGVERAGFPELAQESAPAKLPRPLFAGQRYARIAVGHLPFALLLVAPVAIGRASLDEVMQGFSAQMTARQLGLAAYSLVMVIGGVALLANAVLILKEGLSAVRIFRRWFPAFLAIDLVATGAWIVVAFFGTEGRHTPAFVGIIVAATLFALPFVQLHMAKQWMTDTPEVAALPQQ